MLLHMSVMTCLQFEVFDFLFTGHEIKGSLSQHSFLHVESLVEHTHLLITFNKLQTCIITLL